MDKNYLFRKSLAVVIVLLFMGAGIIPSTAQDMEKPSQPILNRNTLYVGGDGPNNYSSIQSAINNASNWYTIFVYNGTYYEHLVVNKILVIKGEDRNITIIDGSGSGDVILITGIRVNITGFTIRNSGDSIQSGDPDAGIYIDSDYTDIGGNEITNNRYGIFVDYAASNGLISNNRIIDNRGDGIFLYHGSGNMNISDNVIENNNQEGTYARGGIWVDQSSSNIISGNIILNNSGWGNILMSNGCYNNIITGNIIDHDIKGIYVYPSCDDNIISYNWIHDNGVGIYIKLGNDNNQIFCNNITNNVYGIWFDVYSSIDNNIFHNNFMSNYYHAVDPYGNIWDDGYPSGGNFWDDYTGLDMNGDRIGDTPYGIPGGNSIDHYPLMYPFGPPYAFFQYSILNRSVLFDASHSYDYDGNITNYLWDFGDGTNGTGMSIDHDYSESGYFYVTLTVVDNDGKQDTAMRIILIVPIPNLEGDGTLSWTDVKPGSTIEGNFTVENIGENESNLNWEIASYPEWGIWTFTPPNGTQLRPEDGLITINVVVRVPLKRNREFTGNITIVNSDNISDYDTIPISLATPYQNHWTMIEILHALIERFPHLFPILRYLLELGDI